MNVVNNNRNEHSPRQEKSSYSESGKLPLAFVSNLQLTSVLIRREKQKSVHVWRSIFEFDAHK